MTLKRASYSDLGSPPSARYLDLREANEQLVVAAIEEQELRIIAERALRRQHDLVTVIAHELRNPLSPILTAAQSLETVVTSAPLVPRVRAIIERQVAQMSRLVNDLLDMSRLTTGRFKLEKQMVDFISIIDAVIENCGDLVVTRHQLLTVRKPEFPLKINGDAARLIQALSNLTDNALKYTPDGGAIRLEVTVEGSAAVITLSDNGIGITPEALPYVFEPFQQDRHAIAFNDAGLGIGLTVVRELIVAHGGTVTAHSAGRGLGSRFIITLPLAQ